MCKLVFMSPRLDPGLHSGGVVGRDAPHANGSPASIDLAPPPRSEPAHGAIRERDTVSDVVLAAALHSARDRFTHRPAIVRMHGVEEPLQVIRLGRVDAEQCELLWIRPERPPGDVLHPHAKTCGGRHQAHPLFALAQLELRPPPDTALCEECGDQRSLRKQEHDHDNDVPPVSLPERRLAVPKDCVGRNRGLVEPEST